MSRSSKNTTMELLVSGGDQKLGILVEDQGRVNDKTYLEDRKVMILNSFFFFLLQILNNQFHLGDFIERDIGKTYPRSVGDDRISFERNFVVGLSKYSTGRPVAGVLQRRFHRTAKRKTPETLRHLLGYVWVVEG